MRKSIACILISLVFLGYPQKSHAIALPAAALAAATALIVSGVAYYHLNPNQNFSVVGDKIRVAAHCSYFTILAASKTVQAVTDSIVGTMSIDKMLGLIDSHAADFPKLFSATHPSPLFGTYPVGTVLSVNGVNWQTTSPSHCGALYINYWHPDATTEYGGGQIHTITAGTGWQTECYTTVVGTNLPVTPSGALSPQAAADAVSALSADATANDEIRRLTQLAPPVPATDYVKPSSDELYPVPERAVSEVKARAAESAFAQESAAAAAAAAAATHASSAAAAAAADPNNQDLANQAGAAAAAAAAAQSALAAATAAADAAADKANDTPADFEPPPELIKFNWGSAHKLLGAMQTAWPFNLLLTLRGLFSPLESSPVAPSFDYVISGHTYTVSLSRFDGLASITRWVFSVLLISGAIMAVVRWYRGSS